MKKAWIWIVLGIVVLLGVGGGILFSRISTGMAALLTRPIDAVDFSQVPDGNYLGDYSAFPVSVTVKVTVSDGVVTEIVLLEHVNGQGAAGEGVVEMVLDSQTLDVDAIAGATYSSKCILSAIENALEEQRPSD